MSFQLKYSYDSLMQILPKKISNQIIMVYTNCAKKTDMNFNHFGLNSIFGFPQSKVIPFIFMDNPLPEVLKTQKLLKTSNLYGHGFEEYMLEQLTAKFQTTA